MSVQQAWNQVDYCSRTAPREGEAAIRETNNGNRCHALPRQAWPGPGERNGIGLSCYEEQHRLQTYQSKENKPLSLPPVTLNPSVAIAFITTYRFGTDHKTVNGSKREERVKSNGWTRIRPVARRQPIGEPPHPHLDPGPDCFRDRGLLGSRRSTKKRLKHSSSFSH